MSLRSYNLPYKGNEKRDISPLDTPQLRKRGIEKGEGAYELPLSEAIISFDGKYVSLFLDILRPDISRDD